MMLRFWLVFLAAIGVILIWSASDSSERTLTPLTYDAIPEARVVSPARFREVSLAQGIAFEHRQSTGELSSFVDTLGADVCVLNVNQDSWPDVFLVGGTGTRRHFGKPAWWANGSGNRLYINEAGSFIDQTTNFFEELPESLVPMGCTAADLDEDGQEDLLVYGDGGLIALWRRGDKFISEVLLESPGVYTDAVVLDVNNDGHQDIYVTGLVNYEPGKNIFERFSGFTLQDPAFDPVHYDAIANVLLVNNGSLSFSDQTATYSVANAQGRSLGAESKDLNEDGWPDILVVNGFSTPNQVYLNQQGGKFTTTEAFSAVKTSSQAAIQKGEQWLIGRSGKFPPGYYQPLKPTVSSFEDISRAAGLGLPELINASTWDLLVADFNLDGQDDVLMVNGHLRPDKDAHLATAGQPNYLLTGNGQGFSKSLLDLEDQFRSSRQVAALDYDQDGDLDVLVANNNDRFLLYENLTVHPELTTPSDLGEDARLTLASILWVLKDAARLDEVWSELTAQSKIQLLSELGTDRSASSHILIEHGLRDRDRQVNRTAIAAARKAELDWSIDWLIPLLAGESSLSCATSELFAHFFNEEEIAIRRKHLALKALSRVAESKGDAAVCAIEALGYSENKRVLPSLQRIAAESTDAKQRATAVRAMGQIRDTGSAPFLRTLVTSDPEPAVVAASLIALRRLAAGIPLTQALAERDRSEQLQIITRLYQSPDKAVLGQGPLAENLQRLITSSRDAAESNELYGAIAASRDNRFAEFLKERRSEGPAYVRANAALTRRLPAGFESLSDQALQDIVNDFPLSVTYSQFLVLENRLSERSLGRLFRGMTRKDLSNVVSHLFHKGDNVEEWLQRCAAAPGAPVNPDVAREFLPALVEAKSKVLGDAVQCFLFGKQVRVENKVLLSNRVLVRSLEPGLTESARRRLRLHLARFDNFYLPGVSELGPNEISDYLAAQGPVSDVQLENWYRDETLVLDTRLIVLKEIALKNKPKAAALLMGL